MLPGGRSLINFVISTILVDSVELTKRLPKTENIYPGKIHAAMSIHST